MRALVVDRDPQRRREVEALLLALGARPTLLADAGGASDELRRAAAAGEPYAVLLDEAELGSAEALRVRLADEHALAGGATAAEVALERPPTRAALAAALARVLSAAPPAATAASEVLQRGRLIALMGGDEAIAQQVLDRFVASAPALLDAVEEAVSVGDDVALLGSAHRLKGSLRWIGADRAAALATRVEDLGRVGDAASAGALCRRLRAETEFVFATIRALAELSSAATTHADANPEREPRG